MGIDYPNEPWDGIGRAERQKESWEAVVALAMSDGEWLGRHGGSMTPSEVIEIRERALKGRIAELAALLKAPTNT